MKKKLGTIAERTKGVFLDELEVTQFAFERLSQMFERFAKAHNANGRLLKEAEIQLHQHGDKLRELQSRERKGRRQ
jgi:hypothetical protein